MREVGKLFFCIGLPRCGKSTFCQKWANGDILSKVSVDYDSDNMSYKINRLVKRVVVNVDEIRLSLHGNRYEPLAETMVFAITHVMIRTLLNQGYDVIVDETNTTEISIQRLLEIDPNATPIFIDTPIEECKKRAIETGQPDLLPVIDRIYGNLQRIKEVGIETFIKKIVKKIKERGLYECNRT